MTYTRPVRATDAAEARTLAEAGLRLPAIAEALGLTYEQARHVCRRHGIETAAKHGSIAERAAAIVDAQPGIGRTELASLAGCSPHYASMMLTGRRPMRRAEVTDFPPTPAQRREWRESGARHLFDPKLAQELSA